MSFTAKYEGRCAAVTCVYGGNLIEPGDDCTYVDDEIMHAACATRARRAPKLCCWCNIEHNGECP